MLPVNAPDTDAGAAAMASVINRSQGRAPSSAARAEKKSSSRKREPAAQEKWKYAWKSMITILLFQTEEDKDDWTQYSVHKTEERIYKRSDQNRIKEYIKKRVFKFGDLRYLFRDDTGIDFEHSDGFSTFEHVEDLTNEQMFSLKRKFDLFSKWCREKLSGMEAFFNRRDYDEDSSGFTEFALIQERGYSNDGKRTHLNFSTRKGKYGLTKKLARTRQGTINKASQKLILKICDLTRVLNFFYLEFDNIVDEMGQHGVIKDIAGGRADLVNILKVIDNVNGYDELDENDSAIPELEGNIAWTKLGQQLIKPLKQKIDEEKERRRAAAPAAPATKQQTSALVPPQSSAAADDLASQHYTERKPRKKGLFKTDPKKLLALSKRRREESQARRRGARINNPEEAVGHSEPVAPPSSAARSAVVRGKCPFCLKDVTTAQARVKVGGVYYHQVCHEAKEQGWRSRESRSKRPGYALYMHSQLAPQGRWNPPKKEGDKYVGGRKTKRRNGKKKQTKRRKTRGRKTIRRKNRGRKTRKR